MPLNMKAATGCSREKGNVFEYPWDNQLVEIVVYIALERILSCGAHGPSDISTTILE